LALVILGDILLASVVFGDVLLNLVVLGDILVEVTSLSLVGIDSSVALIHPLIGACALTNQCFLE